MLYPSEGSCETKDLKFIFSKLTEIYGDIPVNYFYNFLKTDNCKEDKNLKGNISEFETLNNEEFLRDNPTAIFPDDKTWCIISDFDLPFSYVGGTDEFINKITNNYHFEIFKIEKIFNEKLETNTISPN